MTAQGGGERAGGPGKAPNRSVLVWGLLFTLLFAALYVARPSLLRPLDTLHYDWLLRSMPHSRGDERVVIVDLDERSLMRFGQWPWPRHRVAELCERIAEQQPAIVGLDMFFSEPDRTSPARSIRDRGDSLKLDPAIVRFFEEHVDHDRILAAALAKGPFVLGQQFLFEGVDSGSPDCALRPVPFSVLQRGGGGGMDPQIPQGTGVLCNLPVLAERAVSSGFLNFSPDPDGMLRRLPLLIRYRDNLYPNLALAVFLKFKGADHLVLKRSGDTLRSVVCAGTSIPVDEHGQLLVNFRGPKRSFEYVPAVDILERKVPAGRLRGRIVFVGTTAVGLKESLTTPSSPVFPGVEVHATVTDNLLTGGFLTTPAWAVGATLWMLLLLGGGMSLMVAYRKVASSLMVMALLAGGLWLASQQLFSQRGLFVGPGYPILAMVGTTLLLTLLKYRSEHRHAEGAVRESEVRYRTLTDVVPVGIFRTDGNGVTNYVNPMWCRMSGLPAAEAQGFGWLKAVHPDDREPLLRGWQDAAQQQRASYSDYRFCRPDGSVTWVMGQATPEVNAEGKIIGYVGTITDITERIESERERTELQKQLNTSQKLEAIGVLAGGVAHDFNNMLGTIIGYAELAMIKMEPADPHRQSFERILQAAQRSANLTRQLLAFARKQPIKPVAFDLNEAIEALLKMIRRLIGENIDLVWLPGTGKYTVRMDPSQIDQILVNLCVNARDAIAEVGRIILETSQATFDEEYCATHAGYSPGTYVFLAVSDNGSGMDQKTLDRVFEPFFTTKEVGKGTGLGLSTVYGIAKQNEGFIHVSSELGKGATFQVFLPRFGSDPVAESGELVEETRVGGDEVILLVEDDQALLEMSQTILQRSGYSVKIAGTPAEAIRIAEETRGEIHLLITDIVMPGMNGRALAERLMTIRPKMKHLFMSGYTADVISHQGVVDEGVDFIQKPFSVKDLAAKVREVLG